MGKTKKIGIVGGGSWATALAKILCNNVDTLHWWVRNDKTLEHLQKYRHNPRYLSSVEFEDARLKLTTDVKEIVSHVDIVILAVPSAFLHDCLDGLTEEDFKGKVVFSAIKGIIPEYNAIVARYIHKTYGVPYDNIGIICGPCHAEEVALERLSYLTVACMDEEHATELADLLACRYIKASVTEDVFGTEISAVYKNIVAICCGICHGIGYGDNFQAVLISNAICEIERFVDAVSPVHRDVKSSAYLGDLLVTSYSQFSRNRTFGMMLGKGYTVRSAQLEMNMIAEGYYAAKSIHEINKKFEVDMPIATAVYNVLYEKYSPVVEMKLLADSFT